MWDVTPDSARDYLVQTGRLAAAASATITPLAWGVSNLVLRVECSDGPAFVLKQSRPQLRTKIEWLSRCERIYREADFLRAIGPLLPSGAVPQVLFEDRPNYVLGLSAIRADHVVWKQALLEGRLDPVVAATLGRLLGTIHRATALRPELLPDAPDWSLFDELRIDPFYRWIARVHLALARPIDALLADMARHRACLVHADFSPKNVLVHPDGVSLVDFETGHFGDPAFDLGFFLSHLLLKSSLQPARWVAWRRLIGAFWDAYRDTFASGDADLVVTPSATSPRAVAHLAGCLLARVDGKSPVDYLPPPTHQPLVRAVALRWFERLPPTLDHALDDFGNTLTQACGAG